MPTVCHVWFVVVHMSRKKYIQLMRVGVAVMALLCVLFLVYPFNGNTFTKDDRFVQALSARADSDRYIILAMTDEAFVDMAINFYEASLRAHHVDNFLFVGVGRRTCETLRNMSIPCFYYTDDQSAGEASSFRQRDFLRKMNIRTDMILEALAANFTVVHTDIDVAFFGNPLSEIKVTAYNRMFFFVLNRAFIILTMKRCDFVFPVLPGSAGALIS